MQGSNLIATGSAAFPNAAEGTSFTGTISLKRKGFIWFSVESIVVLCFLWIALHNLTDSWDDGAITAAYARTFAESGRIALTPGSPVVEGTSSLTWFLLLSVARLFSGNPNFILVWMKCLSAVSLFLALIFFFKTAREQLGGSNELAHACTLILAFTYTSFLEVNNGMEMNLAMLLSLCLFYLLTRSPCGRRSVFIAWIISTLLMATRFESPLTLLCVCAGLWLDGDRRDDRPSRTELVAFAVMALASFACLELWRHHKFGLWMPNTVYAKEWPPYSGWREGWPTGRWWACLASAMGKLLPTLGLPLLITCIVSTKLLIRSGRTAFSSLKPVSQGVWTLAVGAVVIGGITGNDWGYSGRTIVPLLPFLILAVVAICKSASSKKAQLIPLLSSMVVIQAFILLLVVGYAPKSSVSIDRIKSIGTGADAIRKTLQRDTLVVMLPDVGGSSLYAEHLRILDSALLSNPELATLGWSHFEGYFRANRPDVVETHGVWAKEQNAYANGTLSDYSIVAANGNRFFVRNDLFAKLVAVNGTAVVPVEGFPSCLGGLDPEDNAFSRSKEVCLLLWQPEKPIVDVLPTARSVTVSNVRNDRPNETRLVQSRASGRSTVRWWALEKAGPEGQRHAN